jgi:sugar phosphate isomerase/epimerase
MKSTLLSLTLMAGMMSAPLLAADARTGVGASFAGPIGLQLYSLRDQFKQDVPGTLDLVKRLGFRDVELAGTYGMKPEEFRAQLAARGLNPVAGHFGYDKLRDDVESVAREAKALGVKYVGCAWIAHQAPFDEAQCRAAAAVFNKAGAALQKHGLKFYYHIHGYEFQPYGQGTLFDLLMKETDPKLVAFQMDVFWAAHPGQDPVKLLEKYGSRWELMHLKDMRKGTETGLLTGKSDVKNDVAMGQGQIDMVPLLKAAKKVGVKWYFIEDESPSVVEQIPVSLKWLEQVKF